MRNFRFMVGSELLAILLAFGQFAGYSSAQAQGEFESRVVHGEILSGNRSVGSLTVKVRPSGGGFAESASVNSDGSFELRSISPGMHEIEVIGSDGTVVYEGPVVIQSVMGPFSIRLPDAPRVQKAGNYTVSIRELQHKAPPPAKKAFRKGYDAAAKGDDVTAIRLFQEAIGVDPEFVEAYNALGAVYLSQSDLPEALNQLRKAVDLVPDFQPALVNLGIVLERLKNYDEAVVTARKALEINPLDSRSHVVLAASMLAQGGDSAEALEHLKRAANDIPVAYLVAGRVLFNSGRTDEARKSVEAYLQNTKATDTHRAEAQSLLEQWK